MECNTFTYISKNNFSWLLIKIGLIILLTSFFLVLKGNQLKKLILKMFCVNFFCTCPQFIQMRLNVFVQVVEHTTGTAPVADGSLL